MKSMWLAAAVVALGPGGAGAADLLVVAPGAVPGAVPGVVVLPTPLEWLRYVRPQVGRDVVVPTTAGATVATIEWWQPVEVRVRTESGLALSEPEKAAILAEALTCRRGEPADARTYVERNGTYVIEYRCAWLQGSEGQ